MVYATMYRLFFFYLLPLSLVMVSSIEKRDGSGRSRISIQTL